VMLNGAVVGHTPCEVRKFWNGKDLVFTVEKPGYKTDQFSVTEKPESFDTHHKAELVRDYQFVVDSSSALVAFDKLLAEFPSGKLIGHKVEFGLSRDLGGFCTCGR
jgi:hypothetical protein